MPTIEVSINDLEELTGKKLPRDIEELNDVLQAAKGEAERLEGDRLTLSIEDANRPDLWSVEGFAMEMRGALGAERGLPAFPFKKSNFTIKVDANLKEIRPYIAAAIIKGVRLTDDIIKGLMQTQDKIDGTYGRSRRKSSIGLYNFDLLSWPLTYESGSPQENPFVPLGFGEKMLPADIIKKHPKGQEYGKLLAGASRWPIFKDAEGKMLSLPPITNSADLGRITEQTTNILIEVTGTDWATVSNALRIMTIALTERGGQVIPVTVEYPYSVAGSRKIITPDFEPRKIRAKVEEINCLLGTELSGAQMVTLLAKAHCKAQAKGSTLDVQVPAWRTDVMHWVDIAEDIAIHHGYQKFEPIPPALPTVGASAPREKYSDRIRELLIGLKMQEVLNFTLTNTNDLLAKMNMTQERLIELENPVSSEYAVLRNWLLPGLLRFLASNRIHEYPQKIFEVGDCVVTDALAAERSRTMRKVAFAVAHDKVNFTEAKSKIEALLRNMGIEWSISPCSHPSFIESRCGEIKVKGKPAGFLGEIRPEVLANWGIEMPVIAAEIDLDQLAPQKSEQG
ncbi:MAG: phenylalanine--tRNA ligase subunit beta [Candidatus Aenigmatarchaeota archaeon]